MIVAADTLNSVLAALGWSTAASDNPSAQGRRVIDSDGADLGICTANETWRELRRRGLVDFADRTIAAEYDAEIARAERAA